MARRLCFDERAGIKAMAQAGCGTAMIVQRLDRHRSTVWWELRRSGGVQAYRTRAA